MTQKHWLNLVIFVSILGIFFGVFVGQRAKNSDQAIAAKTKKVLILPTPRSIDPFNLVRENGNAFTQKNLYQHWTLMFFGFTNCPHICPTTMAELAKMYQSLNRRNFKPLPQVIMVSVDPVRDNIKRLADYVRGFNNQFIGLTGRKTQIARLARQLGIVFMRSNLNNKKNYDIDHSGAIAVFAPDGKVHAFFSMPHNADVLVHDYMLLTQKSYFLAKKLKTKRSQ